MIKEIPNTFESVMPVNGEFVIRGHNRQRETTTYGPSFPTLEAADVFIAKRAGVPKINVTKAA